MTDWEHVRGKTKIAGWEHAYKSIAIRIKRITGKKVVREVLTYRTHPWLSSYGPRGWCVEVYLLDDGSHAVLSGDRTGFDLAIVRDFEMPCMAYNRECEQIAIAHSAGLDRQPVAQLYMSY